MLLFNIFLSSKNSSTSRKGKTSVIKLLHIFKCHLFTQLFVQHITVFYFIFIFGWEKRVNIFQKRVLL